MQRLKRAGVETPHSRTPRLDRQPSALPGYYTHITILHIHNSCQQSKGRLSRGIALGSPLPNLRTRAKGDEWTPDWLSPLTQRLGAECQGCSKKRCAEGDWGPEAQAPQLSSSLPRDFDPEILAVSTRLSAASAGSGIAPLSIISARRDSHQLPQYGRRATLVRASCGAGTRLCRTGGYGAGDTSRATCSTEILLSLLRLLTPFL